MYKNPWKQLLEFQTLKMDADEDIEIFAEKYVKARKAVEIDGCEATKYFLALPFRVRDIMAR